MYAQHETIKIMIQMLKINQQKRLLNFKVSKLISSDLQKYSQLHSSKVIINMQLIIYNEFLLPVILIFMMRFHVVFFFSSTTRFLFMYLMLVFFVFVMLQSLVTYDIIPEKTFMYF